MKVVQYKIHVYIYKSLILLLECMHAWMYVCMYFYINIQFSLPGGNGGIPGIPDIPGIPGIIPPKPKSIFGIPFSSNSNSGANS